MYEDAKRDLTEEIAAALADGAYRPGEWLRQIDLEESFKASRFDVRKALERLLARKLIEHVPNRGYRVLAPDTDTVRQVREVRAILESAAAVGACRQISHECISELEQAASRFEEAARTGTAAEISRENHAFHRSLYEACGNPVLIEMIWSLRGRVSRSPVTIWTSHEALLTSGLEHREMIAALRERDEKRLSGLVEQHVLKVDAGVRSEASTEARTSQKPAARANSQSSRRTVKQ